MKTIGRILLVLLVVAAAVGGGAFLFLPRPPVADAQQTAPTAPVTRGRIEETVGATGNVAAVQQASLAFGASGQVIKVLVEKGQPVVAGQVLAELDSTTLQWSVARAQASLNTAGAQLTQAQQPATEADLASARAAIASAEANYAKVKAGPTAADLAAAQAAVASAKVALQQAQAAYDQVKDRPDVAMLPQSATLQNATIQYEQATANYKSAAGHPTAAELAAAAAQVAQAKASLAQLEAKPDPEQVALVQSQVQETQLALQQAQSQLSDAVLQAPFDGTILAVNVVPGDMASAAMPAIVLATTDRLLLSVSVDEVDVGQVAEGQPAHLTFDAFPGQQVEGTVAFIAPSATSVNGQVAYAVDVTFDAASVPVRVGMTAAVKIVVQQAEGALLVPSRAVTADRDAGKYYVTRRQPDGSSQWLEVRIGLRDGKNIQIAQGVNEGDLLELPVIPSTQTTQEGGPFSMFRGPGGGGQPSGAPAGSGASPGGSPGGSQ